jgi:hypothetical protein
MLKKPNPGHAETSAATSSFLYVFLKRRTLSIASMPKKKTGIPLLIAETAGINFLAPEIKRRVVHDLI